MGTLEITLCLLLPFLFSLCNRLRGNYWSIPVISITKFFDAVMGAIIGVGMVNLLDINNWWILLFSVSFIIGETPGWGKWMGALVSRIDNKWYLDEDDTGLMFRLDSLIYDTIHAIANFIRNERKDYYGYSFIALALRGVYWWFMALFPAFIFNYISGDLMSNIWLLVLIPILGVGFPIVCHVVFRPKGESFPTIPYLASKSSWAELNWSYSELAYGFWYGFWLSLYYIIII